jgi:hypothetical protein
MWELVAVTMGVVLLGGIGVALEHEGGAPAAVGALLVATGGGISGFVVALVLGIAMWPGAACAVLCPSCYRPPAPDQLLRVGLVYFCVLGGLVGLAPGRAFRAGCATGVLWVALPSMQAWVAGGAGLALLAGLAVLWLLSAIRWAAGRALAEGPDGPALAGSTDFWDGTAWRPDPTGGGGR